MLDPIAFFPTGLAVSTGVCSAVCAKCVLDIYWSPYKTHRFISAAAGVIVAIMLGFMWGRVGGFSSGFRIGAAEAEAPFNLFDAQPPMPPAVFTEDGQSRVRFVSAYKAIGSCGINAIACYVPKHNFVVIANPCQDAFRSDEYALLLCHELAHVNGWQHEEAVNFQTFTGENLFRASDNLRDR